MLQLFRSRVGAGTVIEQKLDSFGPAIVDSLTESSPSTDLVVAFTAPAEISLDFSDLEVNRGSKFNTKGQGVSIFSASTESERKPAFAASLVELDVQDSVEVPVGSRKARGESEGQAGADTKKKLCRKIPDGENSDLLCRHGVVQARSQDEGDKRRVR